MHCPVCSDQSLKTVCTTNGVEIDICDHCDGIWLDRGEIFHFSTQTKKTETLFSEATKQQRPTDRLSPRTGNPMVEITIPEGPAIDYCPETEGLWLDKNELNGLLATNREINLQIDRNFRNRQAAVESPGQGVAGNDAQSTVFADTALLALPNLFLHSSLTLVGLYFFLGIILIAIVEFAGLQVEAAIIIAVVIALIQFLLGPFIMDLSLCWLYRMTWVELESLPGHLQEFIERVSKDQGIRPPRMGIIDDGSPQAFTYGHTPNNARIVLSQGLIDILEPEETEAVVAHEIGHAVHWDMFFNDRYSVGPANNLLHLPDVNPRSDTWKKKCCRCSASRLHGVPALSPE